MFAVEHAVCRDMNDLVLRQLRTSCGCAARFEADGFERVVWRSSPVNSVRFHRGEFQALNAAIDDQTSVTKCARVILRTRISESNHSRVKLIENRVRQNR